MNCLGRPVRESDCTSSDILHEKESVCWPNLLNNIVLVNLTDRYVGKANWKQVFKLGHRLVLRAS